MKPATTVLKIALTMVSIAAAAVATCERVNWGQRLIAYQKPSFDISRDGRRIVYANWDGDFAVVDTQSWMHRRLHILPTNRNADPAISPDGRFLAFASRTAAEEKSHIYLYDFSARSLRRITSPDFNDTLPAFTPDGASLIFARSVPSDDLAYPLKQIILNFDPELQSFFRVSLKSDEVKQISKASFHEIARPTVDGDTLYFSAWNDGRGVPQNTFEMSLATKVIQTPSIPEYGRGTEPVSLAYADRLEIATDGQTPDLWPLYLSPDRHPWSTFPMKFDRDSFRCVEAKWDQADPNTIVVLADDGNTSSGGQFTLWRTDANGQKLKRIL